MMAPKAAVLVFPGSNGERDLFETLLAAGFAPFYQAAGQPVGADVVLAALPGGFSYGDYWRAGMLASQAPAVVSLHDLVRRQGLVIGICNGFQILVEANFLPGALCHNKPPGFQHRWLDVRVTPSQPTPWLFGIEAGEVLRLPISHGEGNYFHPDGPAAFQARVPLVYAENPNGSMHDAAALLDETGHILGMMPHPERAADSALGSADGMRLFTAARRWFDAHWERSH